MEAMESEKNAKKLLSDFPVEVRPSVSKNNPLIPTHLIQTILFSLSQLRKPILYLVTLTARSALSDLTEDIFNYVRDRFFVGETVEVNLIGDHW